MVKPPEFPADTSTLLREVCEVRKHADLIFERKQIESALDDLAKKLIPRIRDTNAVVLCVMNGALMALGYLLTRINCPLQVDYVHATRYGDKTKGGALEWFAVPKQPLHDRTVLIFDDVRDEGNTLSALTKWCKNKNAYSVLTATMVDKQNGDLGTVPADFNALIAPNRYLFGFGMDYKGYLRNESGIYAVREK